MKIVKDIIEYFRRDDFGFYEETLNKLNNKPNDEEEVRRLQECLDRDKKLIDLILEDSIK